MISSTYKNIGNSMFSSAIWGEYARVNFSEADECNLKSSKNSKFFFKVEALSQRRNHVTVKNQTRKIMADQWRLTTPDLLSQVKRTSPIILSFFVCKQSLFIVLAFPHI